MAAPPPPILRGPNVLRGPSVLRGIIRVARGRPDGIDQFAGTSQAFLASLAPLIAFPLVGTFLMLLNGNGTPAIADLARHHRDPAGPPGAVVRAGAAMGPAGPLAALRHRVQLVPVAAANARLGAADGARHAAASRHVRERRRRDWCSRLAATPCGCIGSWRATASRSRRSAPPSWWWESFGTALLVLAPRLLALQRT